MDLPNQVLTQTDRSSVVSLRAFTIGPVGHLTLFFWALGMVMLIPQAKLVWAAGIYLAVAGVCYPRSFRRVLRVRYLLMMFLMMLPTIFFLGDLDRHMGSIGYSSEGVLAAAQIGLRFIVVLIAVDGFTHAVDIPQIAGFLERFGLHGLGFSMGVALNLLPSLQQSASHAWQALQMRGGLRRRKWRGLQLLAMTIVTNALTRAEEIALAAEARAFSPEHIRPMPLPSFWSDKVLAGAGLVVLVVLILW